MARFYDAGFTVVSDEERAAQRQRLQEQFAALGVPWNGEAGGGSKVPMEGVSQLPTMDFRTGGDAVSPWTPEEAMAQLGPNGQFGGYMAPAPVIGEAARGAFLSDQPVSLYERGGGQSGYGGGSTLGGAVGMGGGYGMGSLAGGGVGALRGMFGMGGGGGQPSASSGWFAGMGGGPRTQPVYGQEAAAGRSRYASPASGVQGPSGRSLPSPFGGSGYSTLGQVGGSGYGRRY